MSQADETQGLGAKTLDGLAGAEVAQVHVLDLKSRAEELAVRLISAGTRLREAGIVPSSELIADVQTVQQAFARLRAEAIGLALQAGLGEAIAGEACDMLPDLADLVALLVEHFQSLEHQRRPFREADASLCGLADLISCDASAQDVLLQFQSRLRALRAQLQAAARGEAVGDGDELLAEAARYQPMWRLACEGKTLTYDESFDLFNQAAEAVERRLVWAVAMGRVVPRRRDTEVVMEETAGGHVVAEAPPSSAPEIAEVASITVPTTTIGVESGPTVHSSVLGVEPPALLPHPANVASPVGGGEVQAAELRATPSAEKPLVARDAEAATTAAILGEVAIPEKAAELAAEPLKPSAEPAPEPSRTLSSKDSPDTIDASTSRSDDNVPPPLATQVPAIDPKPGPESVAKPEPKPEMKRKSATLTPVKAAISGEALRAAGTLQINEAVTLVRQADATSQTGAVNCLIWCLLRDGRPGLACHLARYLEENDQPADISSSLLESLVAGPLLTSSSGFVADRLSDHRGLIDPFHGDAGQNPGEVGYLVRAMLVLAASMRPALLAPGTGAPDLVRGLVFPDELAALARLRDILLAPSRANLVLTAALLKGNRAQERWQQAMSALQGRAADWLTRNRMGKVIYQPTTQVWHNWLEDGRPIARLVRLVSDGEGSGATPIRKECALWRDKQHVDRELHRTDGELRGVGAVRLPIDARAVTAIRKKCAEAAGLVEEWLDMFEHRPAGTSSWLATQVDQCRANLLTSLPQCRESLEAWGHDRAESVCLPLAAAVRTMLRSLEDLALLLDADQESRGDAMHLRRRLNQDLLRIPDLDLDEAWQPCQPGSPEVLQCILSLLTVDEWAWRQILETRWQDGDFLAADRILTLLEEAGEDEAGGPADDLSELRARQDQLLRAGRAKLGDEIRRLMFLVEDARGKNLIDENLRLELTGQIDAIHVEQTMQIARHRTTLAAVESCLQESKRHRIADFRQQINDHHVAAKEPAVYRRLMAVLDHEDLLTANEYLTIYERGGTLPRPAQAPPGMDFFPDFFEQVEEVTSGKSKLGLREIARIFGERGRLGSIDLGPRLTPSDAKACEDVLGAWVRLRSGRGHAAQAIREVLDFIGFPVKQLTQTGPEVAGRGVWYELEIEGLQSRNDCLLPDFGSRCEGRYSVVQLDGQPLEEQLLRDAKTEYRSQPVIALFLSVMSSRRRRDLAHALRRHQSRRLLVLDDVLLMYLCLQKRRLLSFFNAAGVFSPAEPYTTTPGLVPTEMFFGRGPEIDSVFDANGTCLVYGGRQLGKTALLREVERRYHRPDSGTLVQFVDLHYGEHLGLNRPPEDIWAVIASRLNPFGVVAAATSRQQTIERAIVDWLTTESQRRIVLLLDEADLFLSSDGKQGWPLVGRLKTIMDTTGRRFKVVFAGLHNVQRTSHDVNTPMAHLGNPICVGPFLSDEELRDALQMVELPFRAMGYRFESDELIFRVLAQTNYYPSLIQLFCKQLLHHLSNPDRAAFSPVETPPYTIRPQHIENAYTDNELRKQIYDRFRWTLELDNRYRVIALRLALQMLLEPAAGARGFTVAQIRDWAIAEWPVGFTESQSNDVFRTLLDEMQELGVLRTVTTGRYAMRSPNVISLLGTEDNILATLSDAVQEDPPAEKQYEPASFRRVLDPHAKWRRSPLTAQQESELLKPAENGLFVVLGMRASGLDAVPPLLQLLARDLRSVGLALRVVDDAVDHHQFQLLLKQYVEEREDGLTLIQVAPQCPWGEAWLRIAAELLQARGTAKRRFFKVVFLAGPREAWWWSDLAQETERRLHRTEVREFSLCPWNDRAVRQWKKEAEFGENTEAENRRFRQVTGYWGYFLHQLGQQCVERGHQWREAVDRFQQEVLHSRRSLEAFDLPAEVLPMLQVMAEYGDPLTQEDLAGLLSDGGGDSLATIQRVVRWGHLLQIIRPCGEEQWQLDPFLQHLLVNLAHAT